MAEPGFWNNQVKAKPDIERLKVLRSKLDPLAALQKGLADLEAMLELVKEPGGGDFLPDASRLAAKMIGDLDRFDLEVTFSGRFDYSNAYVQVQAGTGGTESCDWARMLIRMYSRWAEQNGFKVEEVDHVADDASGGIRSATLQLDGPYAYGWLRAEIGVHRLIRISPFDANKRRQTSFCSVDVTPVVDEDVDLVIDEKDLNIEKMRAGGAGGQHVNKTESAVRITHIPTGIVVKCQNERSQTMNMASAMKQLKAKLLLIEEAKRDAEIKGLSGPKTDIGFGHQIRTYTFQPYQLVKDHRNGFEVGNVDAVMEGDIGGFLEAFLRSKDGKKAADGK
jgi:peptide chain release factor 2